MNLLIFLGIVVAGILIFAKVKAKKQGTTTTEEVAGICSFVLGQSARKNKNKTEVLKLFENKPELTNADIRKALTISDASAVRYMDELEKEGKIEQIGDTGRGVVYRLKNASVS